jgi:hypothetical protein
MAWLCLCAAGCGGGGGLDAPPECNPIGGVGCLTPWPSAIYEVEDASSPTGMRLDVAPGAFPDTSGGIPFDPVRINRKDGFSPAAQIFTAFPARRPANLVHWRDLPDSLRHSPVLVDMETGRGRPTSPRSTPTPTPIDDRALYIRLAYRLRGGAATRSPSAALRAEGAAAAGAGRFASIVDGGDSGHARLERARPRYDAIFAALEPPACRAMTCWSSGLHTASDDSLIADMQQARDAALEAMATSPPT